MIAIDVRRAPPSWLWALGAAILVLALAYAPNLVDLFSVWCKNPNYSHGFLVVPFAAYIFWKRFSAAKAKPTFNSSVTCYWGWVFLAVILGLRVIAYERNAQWSENVTIVPAVACLIWIFGGWPLLRVAWPSIAFLLFMFPLPPSINNSVSLSLQEIATTGSCFLLQLSHIWVVQAGNTIHLTTRTGEMDRLEVAAACSGLSMLMTLAAVVAATIILIPLPAWKRITILISAVPIALVSNMFRIVATGWCYYFITDSNQKAWAHDISGWFMMPVALALVVTELRILSWLVPTEAISEEDEGEAMVRALTERKTAAERIREPSKDRRKSGLGALIASLGWKKDRAADEPRLILPGTSKKKEGGREFDEL
jgi:exosortase